MENIRELLEKHISGKINSEERKNLKKSLSVLSDIELSNILSDMWDHYDHKMSFDDDIDKLIEKLQIVPQHKKKYSLFYSVMTGVAAVLIPFIVFLNIYYYIDNRKFNDFVAGVTGIDVTSGEKTSITLPDGSNISLNAATSISYPVDFGLNKREITLSGEAFLDVARNEKIPFVVKTDMVFIEVLGTKFNVNAYDNSDIVETSLLEGSVKLTTRGAKAKSVILSPFEKATYHKKNDIMTVSQTNTHFETAWLRGDLVFRSANFSDIMNKLEQRYGVDIEIAGDSYDKDLFTGSFKESYVNGVLKILQIHYDFEYSIDKEEHILIRFN